MRQDASKHWRLCPGPIRVLSGSYPEGHNITKTRGTVFHSCGVFACQPLCGCIETDLRLQSNRAVPATNTGLCLQQNRSEAATKQGCPRIETPSLLSRCHSADENAKRHTSTVAFSPANCSARKAAKCGSGCGSGTLCRTRDSRSCSCGAAASTGKRFSAPASCSCTSRAFDIRCTSKSNTHRCT